MHNADAVAQVIQGMTKGQYLILAEAIRQLGGELRVDPSSLVVGALQPSPQIVVDDTDGPVVIRLKVKIVG